MTLQTEWNFSKLLGGKTVEENMDLEKAEIRKKVEAFEKKWKTDNSYLNDAKILKQALDEYEKLYASTGTYGQIGFYLGLMTDAFPGDEEIKKNYSLMDDFRVEMQNKIAFFEINLSKIEEAKQKEFLALTIFDEYKHFLERIFAMAKHTLSEKEEKILSLKNKTAYENWKLMTSEFLSKSEELVFTGEKEEKKSFSEIQNLMDSQNKKVRDSAAKAINKILLQNKPLAVIEINSVLKDKQVNDELRSFSRPDSSRIISDDIDEELVDSLLASINKNLDISKKFYKLKAELIGQKKLEYHERRVAYGKIDKEYSYESSVKIIKEIFHNLHPEFGKIADMMIDEGRIEVYPKKGKRSGAFCSFGLKSVPTFILLNHTNRLYDVAVMAHELGHAVNHELMKKQNSLSYFNPMATAEVASTFMESFVFDKILQDADEETKLALMVQSVGDDISSIIRQPCGYMFEQELHKEFRKKGFLTGDEIGKIFSKNMAAYMGDYVEQSPGSENWWIYWSHFREYFYVYSYSSGLLISKVMQKMVKEDKKTTEKVKEFLSSGGVESPRGLFKKLGITLNESFWEQGLNELRNSVNKMEELARKLGKIK